MTEKDPMQCDGQLDLLAAAPLPLARDSDPSTSANGARRAERALAPLRRAALGPYLTGAILSAQDAADRAIKANGWSYRRMDSVRRRVSELAQLGYLVAVDDDEGRAIRYSITDAGRQVGARP